MKTMALTAFILISLSFAPAQTPIDSLFDLIEKTENEQKQTECLFGI